MFSAQIEAVHVVKPFALLLSFLCLVLLDDVRGAGRDEQTRRAQQLANYQERYQERQQEYVAELQAVATECERAGFEKEAQGIRESAKPVESTALRANRLPETVKPEIPLDLPEAERAWRLKLNHVREEYADDLYLLSRGALRAGLPSFAYRLVGEVATANPDHVSARRLLGFQRSGEEWVTPFEAQMARERMVWHDKFGWLPRTYLDRYERGERFYKRWMSAEQENEVRRAFNNAWEIRTEHFLVKTNHSLERGVEVAVKLEEFHDFFQHALVGFFYSPEQLQKLFNQTSLTGRVANVRPHEVHYYRTRDEYNQRLIQRIPVIALTNGLYHNGDRVAYFFHDEELTNDSTLYHEATHQLLYETTPRDRPIGEAAHFWVLEGIACYVESLHREQEGLTMGDPAFVRFHWARVRYLKEGYFVPLARFSSMGMREFQSQSKDDLSRSYSQAAGLTHFFMHYDKGTYRDALIEHLAQLYRPPGAARFAAPATLPELTGVSSAELDRQYGEYLRRMELALHGQESRGEGQEPEVRKSQ